MISSGEGSIVLQEVGKFFSEGGGELWSSVRNHLGMKAKSRKNMSEKELGDSSCVNVFPARAINYPLHKTMVYHDHDRVKSVGIR